MGLNLKRISAEEKLVTPVSKTSSKSVSTNNILSVSIKVIFFVFGPIFRINISPVTLECVVDVFCVNSILEASLKLRMYSNSEPAPELTVELKLLEPSPEKVEVPTFVNVEEINELSEEPSIKFRIGELGSVKSILVFPLDSSQFKIPSLSKSTSILSIIKSLSISSGQKLTGII